MKGFMFTLEALAALVLVIILIVSISDIDIEKENQIFSEIKAQSRATYSTYFGEKVDNSIYQENKYCVKKFDYNKGPTIQKNIVCEGFNWIEGLLEQLHLSA